MKRFFLVDAMAMAFRNFHAFGARPLTTANGLPTSSVYGSAQFLINLIKNEKPDYLGIISDTKEKTFRHTMYPEYKANRSAMPEELAAQIPYLFKLFDALHCPVVTEAGFEADDIIGTLVSDHASKEIECFIVSGDKDFMQLINPHVSLYSPKKGGQVLKIGSVGVREKFGCSPEQVVDILALMGDSADNIPGVRGIGEKGAAKLIEKYGSLEGVYEHIGEITNKRQRDGLEQNRKMAELSRELVTIKCDMRNLPGLETFSFDQSAALENPDLLKLFEELEFDRLVGMLEKPSPVALAIKNENIGYKLIDSDSMFAEIIEKVESSDFFSFDTETTGLNIITDKPVGVSFSFSKDEAYYIPLSGFHAQKISSDKIISFLNQVLGSRNIKVAHNAKYDVHMLSNIGVTVCEPIHDTMLASYLIQSTGKSHSLDACCLEEFEFQKMPTSELIGKKAEIPMADVDIDKLCYYACEDADYTLRLYSSYVKRLHENDLWNLYSKIECPLVGVLARMERCGVFIDKDILADLSVRLREMCEKSLAKIYEIAGEEFNVNSPKQMQKILYEKLKVHEELGIKKLKKTKSGFSTDMSVLEQLSAHPIAEHILNYRVMNKLKSTYVDSLPNLIEEKTGRVHTHFHQTIAATGRLSSADPNLQNIPIRSEMGREIRKAFRSEGKKILSADYSQVELRLLAHLSQDKNMSEAFRNGADIHQATADKLFGADDSDGRSKAKAINFGIIYGMGPTRLAKQINVSFKEAQQFIKMYFEQFPSIREYLDGSIESAREHLYTKTMFNRIRPIPEILSDRKLTQVNAENIAVNSPIQGSAADIIKIAMIEIDRELTLQKLDANMLLQVHDELVFEVAINDVDTLSELVKSKMESAVELSVPLVADVGVGDDWLEAH